MYLCGALSSRGVSYWALNHCRHIVWSQSSPIQSAYRPPLAIHNGVDMGRAFSVLLFVYCYGSLALPCPSDSSCTYQPRLYDDNATGGSGLEWLSTPQPSFKNSLMQDSLSLLIIAIVLKLSPPLHQTPCFSACQPITSGFPSIKAALPAFSAPSYLRISSGSKFILPSFFLLPHYLS